MPGAISYEVMAVFAIEDEASPVLIRITEQARAAADALGALGKGDLFAGVQAGADALASSIGRITDAARSLGTGLESGVAAAGSALSRATEQAGALAGAYDKAAEAAARFRATAATGGVFGAGGGEGRELVTIPNFTMPNEPIELGDPGRGGMGGGGRGAGGGHGGFLSGGLFHGMAPLGAAIGDFLAVRTAMQEDRALRQSLSTMGYQVGTPEFNAAYEQMRSTVYGATVGTIFSERQGAMALPSAVGVLGFGGSTPAERAKALSDTAGVFGTAIRMAEVAEQQGLGDLRSNIVAGVEYAHMTGRYAPRELEPALDQLMNLSRLTDKSITAEEGILRYSVPIGRAAGIDADQTAMLTGFLQRMGFNSTTAGTGLGQLILGLTNTGGPLAAHLESASREDRRALSDALGLKPEQLHETIRHRQQDTKHIAALEELGILDKSHRLTVTDEHGNVDVMRLIDDVAAYAKAHQPTDTLNVLRDAFTVRGQRVAGVLDTPDAVNRLIQFDEQQHRMRGARQTQSDLMQAPMNQFEQMLANFANIGNDMVSQTLGPMNALMKDVNTGLIGFSNFLHAHPWAEAAGGAALEAGGVAVGAMGLKGIWNWLFGRRAGAIGKGAAAAAGEDVSAEEIFAGAGEAATGIGGLPLALLGAGIAATGYGIYKQGQSAAQHIQHGDKPAYIDPITGMPVYYPNLPDHVAKHHEQHSSLFGSHGNEDLTSGGPDYKVNKTITMNLSVKVDGAMSITQLAEKITSEITSKLKDALASSGAGATGSDTTPFVFGGL